MYNFKKEVTRRKRFGRIKKGWHAAKIYQASLRYTRNGIPRHYIGAEFEIIREDEYKDILVKGFFSYNENGDADPKFIDMGVSAGLKGDYKNDVDAVLRDLIGKELMIYVVHTYRNKQRRDKAVDFKPLP